MNFIIFILFTVANSFTSSNQKSSRIKDNNCFGNKKSYLINRIKKLENLRRKIILLSDESVKIVKEITNENIKIIKDMNNENMRIINGFIDDEYSYDYSSEWDFYNETWKIKSEHEL